MSIFSDASVVEIIVSVLVVIGGIFGFVGAFGLVKLRDTMQRLHAPTKATTVGVGSVLIASALYFTFVRGQTSFHEILIAAFLFVTAPITANFIAKAYMHRNIAEGDLPPPDESGWAGYHEPPMESPMQVQDAKRDG